MPATAVERFELPNGLRVVLQPDPSAPTVAGAIAYRVGSRDDPTGYRGLAHLVEHMTFRGSRNLPGRASAAQYAAIGASSNGFTTPDRTMYLAEFPARYLPHFLWIESERMAFTLESLAEDTLAIERKVVLNEYRQRSYEQHLQEIVQHTITPQGHPYRPLADSPADPELLGFDDVRWFFQHHYRPDNAVLVLVGRLDVGRTRALIERYFGTLRATGALAPRPPAPAIVFGGSQRLRLSAGTGHSALRIYWNLPCGSDVACVARQALLGTLIRRALSPAAQTKTPFLDIEVNVSAYEQHNEFMVEAQLLSSRDADRVLARIDEVLERLRAGKLGDQELRMAQHAYATQWHYAQESLSARAVDLLDDLDTGAVLETVLQLTVGDIAAATAKLLPRDRRLVVEIRRWRQGTYEGKLAASEGKLLPRSYPAGGARRAAAR